jgi:sugar lactone lactonase YvrE
MSISTLANGLGSINGFDIDDNDNMYVADARTDEIIKITKYGKKTVFASGFNVIMNLAFDAVGFPNGYLYVMDAVTVYKVDKNGTKTIFYALDYATGNNQLVHYFGMAIDSAGNFYYTNAEPGYQGVYKITPSLVLSRFIDGTSNMDYPISITIDPAGNFLISDSHRQNLFKYGAAGNLINSAFITAPVGQGWANVIFDKNNNIYSANCPITGNNVGQYLNKYTSSGAFISTIYTDPLKGILSMVIDSQNNLYFSFADPATSQLDSTTILKFGSPSIIISKT